MVSYDSPITGKKQFQGQPMKEVTIPDESGYAPPSGTRQNFQPPHIDESALRDFQSRMGPPIPTMTQEQAELEQQFRDARESKRIGRERLNEGARRRVEMLVGMTRHTRTFEVGGHTYVLQTLRSKELEDAIVLASAFDGTVRSPFGIRKQLLARSIVQLAGMDFSQFVGSHDLETKLEAIDELDHYLLGRLYDEYLAMVKEARDMYAIKNEQDAKEVVEDLKK